VLLPKFVATSKPRTGTLTGKSEVADSRNFFPAELHDNGKKISGVHVDCMYGVDLLSWSKCICKRKILHHFLICILDWTPNCLRIMLEATYWTQTSPSTS